MAQIDIKNIERIEKQRNSVHDKVYTTYTVFSTADTKYIQFDTYGKSDRKNPGNMSQSFQFDKDTAKEIVRIITNIYKLDSEK